jgi:hypothetical protein
MGASRGDSWKTFGSPIKLPPMIRRHACMFPLVKRRPHVAVRLEEGELERKSSCRAETVHPITSVSPFLATTTLEVGRS